MSNENKLSPVTVYVPVNVIEEYPPINEEIITFEGSEIKVSEFTIGVTSCTTNWDEKVTDWGWLKEQSLYVFNREELEGLLRDAYSKGAWVEQEGHHARDGQEELETLYIQSLFIK